MDAVYLRTDTYRIGILPDMLKSFSCFSHHVWLQHMPCHVGGVIHLRQAAARTGSETLATGSHLFSAVQIAISISRVAWHPSCRGLLEVTIHLPRVFFWGWKADRTAFPRVRPNGEDAGPASASLARILIWEADPGACHRSPACRYVSECMDEGDIQSTYILRSTVKDRWSLGILTKR